MKSMMPLWLATLYDDYEIINNVIKFKENGNIMYEFIIPKGYHLIGIIDYSNGKLFMFSEYEIKPPDNIPKGYTNLTMSSCGLYKVESEDPFLYSEDTKIKSERELYYMDTSHITPNDFKLACNGRYLVNENDIPSNFWFSIQYRNLINEYLGMAPGNWKDRTEIKVVRPYLKSFDLRARIINEYELITILAYNGNGRYSILFEEEGSKFERLIHTDKVFFGYGWVNIENQDKFVSSIENPNVYLCANGDKLIDEPFCSYTSHPIYIADDQPHFWFAIPVIEELENNVKTIKKRCNISRK